MRLNQVNLPADLAPMCAALLCAVNDAATAHTSANVWMVRAEENLTQEVDTDGWDELGDVFAFRYLPEDGRPEDALQVRSASCRGTT